MTELADAATRVDEITPVVAASGLRKSYGQGPTEVEVLRGVDVVLEPSELVVLVGPSGSGKSTLLHLLAGLDQPTEGQVQLEGRDLAELSERERAKLRRTSMGFVLQRDNLVPTLTLLENVAAPLMLGGASRRKAFTAASELLDQVGLMDRRRAWPGEVSGGEAQRAAVARACINDPALVFADEPTGALDSVSGQAVMELLVRQVEQRGAAAMVVTHDRDVAAYGNRIVRISDGQIDDPES